MEVYEYDLVSLLFLVIGIYVMTKNELELTLSAGPTKLNGSVDSDSKYTKSEKLHLGTIQTKILGIALIILSSILYMHIKGELVFTL